MLHQLTSRQFAEWIAYHNRHPFGQHETQKMIAKTAAALWNQHRGKNAEPINEDEFLPKQIEVQSPEEIKAALRRHLK